MFFKKPVYTAVWLALVVVVLALLGRWALLFSTIPEGLLLAIGPFQLIHSKSTVFSLPQLWELLMVPHRWGIWGGLTALYLLAVWRAHVATFLRPPVVITLYLVSGAMLSVALDMLFFNGLPQSLLLNVTGLFSLRLTLSGLILVVGTLYLILVLLNRSARLRSQFQLNPNQIPRVQISRLPRGVDNIHIDVLLSRKFCKSANLCIHNLIPVVVREFQTGKRKIQIPKNQLQPLHEIFSQILEQTLRRAKESGEKELVELLIISVFKYIHEEVDRTIDSYVRSRADAPQGNYQQGGTAERNRKFNEYVARHKENISATTNEIILHALREHHQLPFHKALKGFLGIRDGFAIDLIQTPLALCGHHHSDRALLNNYLLTGQLRKSENHFFRIDDVLAKIFYAYLPLIEKQKSEPGDELLDERISEKMEVLMHPSIFMDPANLKRLLDIEWTRQELEQALRDGDRETKRRLKRHLQFQSGLGQSVIRALVRSPIARWLVASYQVKEIFAKSGTDISPTALMEILVHSTTRPELEERIKKNSHSVNRLPDMALLVTGWEHVHQGCASFIQDNLLRILKDFSRYRRDLLVQNQLLQAYNHIKLLKDERDIQTSRANYTLHDFSIFSESREDQGQVRSHIIIKADLRGSTQVTDKLVGLSLNPASHFERNFFTPVNELIDLYGAEKVFIEGDAIILILNDHESQNSNHHIASRACGLAAHILRVVAQQNKELKCYGLPELELGIGIAYSNSSPRYLFDGDHRITISPAINRADRLSACAWSIREWREKYAAPATQVEVYQPSENAKATGSKAQKDMVFNLNGILIEEDVFEKLQKEINLKKVLNRIPSMQDSNLYSLVFPDLSGSTHRMIVRKAPVKLYDQNHGVDECPVVDGRFFYEVVYKKEILDQLRK